MRFKHFTEIKSPRQRFFAYKNLDAKIYRSCVKLAGRLKKLRVIHINSTALGGGVAELLKNQIPLERSLGLDSRWLVIKQPKSFFQVTKKIHNLLQGQTGALSEEEKIFMLGRLRLPGQELMAFLSGLSDAEVLVLHDPQVLPLIDFVPGAVRTVWRAHADVSRPNKAALEFLRPFFLKARKVIVSHKAYRPPGLPLNKFKISFPAISPFAQKNRPLGEAQIAKLFLAHGIDRQRPVVAQVSRFDPWKDPEGVIEAFYLAKKALPGLQLVLEGSQKAKDDPQAREIFARLKKQYGHDPDLFLRGEKPEAFAAHETWVNALQSGANVVVQKSLKEGFGLTVAEAMWKQKAVIGGDTPGIRLQIKNGRTGFIVNSPQACARRIVELLKHPARAKRLGLSAHVYVKNHFLFNRLIADFLEIYSEILKPG